MGIGITLYPNDRHVKSIIAPLKLFSVRRPITGLEPEFSKVEIPLENNLIFDQSFSYVSFF